MAVASISLQSFGQAPRAVGVSRGACPPNPIVVDVNQRVMGTSVDTGPLPDTCPPLLLDDCEREHRHRDHRRRCVVKVVAASSMVMTVIRARDPRRSRR